MKRKLVVSSLIILALAFGGFGYKTIIAKNIAPVVELSVFGQMNGYNATSFYRSFENAREQGSKEVKIFMMSPGGVVVESFALCDMINQAQKDGMHITTVAYGMIASAAVPVFLCGDTRIAGPNTVFMLHKPDRAGIEDENYIEMMDLDERLYIQLVADNCSLTYEQVDKLCTEYTWFTAKEAMQYGMIDRIE